MSEDAPAVGDVLADVEIGPIAHGGHWVARHEGRVVFVRHALAGERVVVRLTGVAKRHAFGDAVAVIEASPHRVEEPCAIAATCGGCDFQHVEVGHQRELKRQVVAEQVRRLAGIAWDGEVEGVDPDAFGWRTRMRYRRGGEGWGLRRSRSHEVSALPAVGCLIAAPALAAPPPDAAGDEIIGVDGPQGSVWVAPGAETVVTAQAAGRSWRVRADGFWQVHPQAADTLVAAVLDGVRPRPDEVALDLYCGVGLFAGALVDAGLRVTGVEGAREAVELARGNVPEARFLSGGVEKVLARRPPRGRRGGPPALPDRADVVVLDPPRTGAGAAVIEAVARRRPRVVAYVACDPAALARDLRTAGEHGYRVASLRAFDLFPQTHHVECVAILTRG
ncbi:class I SAM-dependent RNA methyltransferase [Propioniciclava coleopterorum]|uniref:Class I SAM-dependent RNA methyltransferase n=1 Tax=Propioniciclava coleopterorum TaxID=2714937 RepID=A0A6G7Y9F1_9ACTN|nr:TRAM domain-containing protein [Propioniciclava coleopterorum]QIK73435.1 class I SAM-dependent RNA methyltransferase [Propioniciclava coleopterorum]